MSLKTVNNSVKTSQSAMSEQDLLAKDAISPEDVLSLNKITDTYLCSPDANQFGIGKFILIFFLKNLIVLLLIRIFMILIIYLQTYFN